MRFLAIDLGDKRTGIAVGDDELRMAQPVCVLEIPIGELLINAILKTIEEQGVDALVIGLPLNMDGTPGQRVVITKAFASNLEIATNMQLYFQDERLTSSAAEEKLSGSGKTHKQKKKIRDALAAAEILNDFLAQL
ncbi:MAG TPA: Holliday junction resolvase RuvX [Phycisphaerales bacterium]|nr:Holliday junction resolvase RuvX [Phycisphaerales bacterium]HIB00723.1 Holliday junction resolvase RuvX [Phycisphaerales bacterium]HIB49889.1 Holliday junction resolvase RuvX [Phycisphaerales bacterium]HIN83479.1 Holliday junction resolvase RuvX [Phycisphaerales bacterium]HIO20405.1 Holliday junction resolvase RuvX [Phycisphaerales bacterium]